MKKEFNLEEELGIKHSNTSGAKHHNEAGFFAGILVIVMTLGVYAFGFVFPNIEQGNQNTASSVTNDTVTQSSTLTQPISSVASPSFGTIDPYAVNSLMTAFPCPAPDWKPDLIITNVTFSPDPLFASDIANSPYPYVNFKVKNPGKCDAVIPASLVLSLYNDVNANNILEPGEPLVMHVVYDRVTKLGKNKSKWFPGQIRWLQNLTPGDYNIITVVDDAHVLNEWNGTPGNTSWEDNNDDYHFGLTVN